MKNKITLKHKLQNKLNNQHKGLSHTYKYINNYTGELSNHPILETIYTLLYTRTPIKTKLAYGFNWVNHK